MFNFFFYTSWCTWCLSGLLFFYFEYSFNQLQVWYLFLFYICFFWLVLFYYYYYLLITAQQQFIIFSWTTSLFGYYFSGVCIDCTSILFSLLIVSLTFFIFYFTLNYLATTVYNLYFLLLLLCFIFSMLLLFHAVDLILLLLAWECIGLFSYLLVAFFGYRIHVSRAALKTFLFARFSDCMLFLCFCNLFYITQTTIIKFCILYINFFFTCQASYFFFFVI